jgi:hypothetical protein
LAVAAAASIAGLPLSASAQQGKLSGDVVKIGVLSDMSGLYADYGGPGAVAAARLAVQDFGGKIFGKNIEVVSAEDEQLEHGAERAAWPHAIQGLPCARGTRRRSRRRRADVAADHGWYWGDCGRRADRGVARAGEYSG